MNKQGISLCLVILTLLLCHCNSSSGRRRYTKLAPYGKRNYAKILKAQDHTSRLEEYPNVGDGRLMIQREEKREYK
ncbi:hypothetical protein ABFA07_007147 [Porites harrisoni]